MGALLSASSAAEVRAILGGHTYAEEEEED